MKSSYLLLGIVLAGASGLSIHHVPRRDVLRSITVVATGVGSAFGPGKPEARAEGQLRNKVNEERFLESGLVSKPMGISGQGSKSKPETGIVLRDGSVVDRDPRTGDVSAEILVKGDEQNQVPIFVSFRSEEWPLAKGLYYDVECRDPKTGDGVFLAATPALAKGQGLEDISDSFLIDSLFSPTGRFSSYGQPTDIKIRNSDSINGDYRTMEVSFSTLSQGTQTEIPRHAQIYATIPAGTRQAILLVGSASESRWQNKGSDELVARSGASFRASPAPPTSLKIRAKPRPTLDVVV